MTFGELFAGIGGFSLGLERAGMTCKWQVEIDPYATAVLRKHWPEVPKHEDVRTFPPQGDYSVDLICGGFPCQDISVAGKGAGLAGERSGLWHDFARIIRTVRPRWVVIENVPALTARGLGTVLGDLAEIGFDAEWHCIPASAVGAPHRRERIWIVAHAIGSRVWDFAASPGRSGRRDAGRRVSALRQAHGAAGTDRTDSAGAAPYSVSDSISERDAMRGHGTPCEKGVAGRDCNAGRGECDCGAGRAGEAREGACNVADAESIGHEGRADAERGRAQSQSERRLRGEPCGRSEVLANAQGVRSRAGFCQDDTKQDGHQSCDRCGDVPDADSAGRQQQRRPESAPAEQPAAECGGWWESEPNVGRVAHGVPSRVDRLRCLGNAVVPQVVEIIGRAILEAEARMTA